MNKVEKFMSLKFSSLRLVLDPKIKKEVQGSLVGSSVFGKFPNGQTVEFENGEYSTSDPEIIKELKSHPYYGTMFVCATQEGTVKISDEGLRSNNERGTIVDDLSSVCPICAKKCKNEAGLIVHMRSHQEK